jgi:hypothetical protein
LLSCVAGSERGKIEAATGAPPDSFIANFGM